MNPAEHSTSQREMSHVAGVKKSHFYRFAAYLLSRCIVENTSTRIHINLRSLAEPSPSRFGRIQMWFFWESKRAHAGIQDRLLVYCEVSPGLIRFLLYRPGLPPVSDTGLGFIFLYLEDRLQLLLPTRSSPLA